MNSGLWWAVSFCTDEVLETVARRAAEMADLLNASGNLPCRMVYKVTAKTNQEIATWCARPTTTPAVRHHHLVPHLQSQQDVDQRLCESAEAYCHFATQYNREIPNEEIDMDFMNLNQPPTATGSTGSWRPAADAAQDHRRVLAG